MAPRVLTAMPSRRAAFREPVPLKSPMSPKLLVSSGTAFVFDEICQALVPSRYGEDYGA